MSGLSLENLDGKLDGLTTKLDAFLASATKKAMTDEEHMKEKDAAIKKANDEKEEEKKEAKRAALEAAIKKANEEEDPEKKDAAIKQAMSNYGNDEEHKDKKDANMHDKDENKEHVAAIILDKKIDIDNKILQAAAVSNPTGLAALTAELEKGTFTASKKMYDNMEKMFGKGIFKAKVPNPTMTQPPPFFMAGAYNPVEIDANQLNASSPVMDFAKLSTKELLEGKTA